MIETGEKYIDCNGLQLSNLALLKEVKTANCSTLSLYYNNLESLRDMPMMPSLTNLNLSANNFTNYILNELMQFTSLLTLDISSNKISSVFWFPNLPLLEKLNLAFNQINTLKGLEGKLASLLSIDFRGNEISRVDDITYPLQSCPILHELKLKGNPVCDVIERVSSLYNDLSPTLRVVDELTYQQWCGIETSFVRTPNFDRVKAAILPHLIAESTRPIATAFTETFSNPPPIPKEMLLLVVVAVLGDRIDKRSKNMAFSRWRRFAQESFRSEIDEQHVLELQLQLEQCENLHKLQLKAHSDKRVLQEKQGLLKLTAALKKTEQLEVELSSVRSELQAQALSVAGISAERDQLVESLHVAQVQLLDAQELAALDETRKAEMQSELTVQLALVQSLRDNQDKLAAELQYTRQMLVSSEERVATQRADIQLLQAEVSAGTVSNQELLALRSKLSELETTVSSSEIELRASEARAQAEVSRLQDAVQQEEGACALLGKEKGRLEAKLDKLHQSFEKLHHQHQQALNSEEVLKAQAAALETANERLTDQYAKAAATNKQLELDVRRLQEIMERVRREAKKCKHCDTHEQSRREVLTELELQRANNAKLVDAAYMVKERIQLCASLEAQHTKDVEAAQALVAERDRLVLSLRVKEKEVEAALARARHAEESLALTRTTLAQMQAQQADSERDREEMGWLQTEIEVLQKKIDEKRSQIASLRAQLRSKDETIDKLRRYNTECYKTGHGALDGLDISESVDLSSWT